jgi:chromate transporter
MPALRQELLASHWATPSDFGHAISIGQLSPGPTGLWAVSLGYLTYGYLGASLALIAITLPPMLVIPVATGYRWISGQPWVPRVMAGVLVAVVGLMAETAWSLAPQPHTDPWGWLIGAGVLGGAATRRLNPGLLLLLAGLIGILLWRG